MKPKPLIVLAIFFVCNHLTAQATKQIISGNEDIAASIPDSVKYLYPAFTFGKVTYREGTTGGSLLNYNLLAAAVQFVSQAGDTLSLANEITIKFITINMDTFYYDKVYLKLVAGNEKAKLAENEKLSMSNIKKGAAFDSYTSSGGVDNVTSLNTGSRTVHLTENKQMVFITHHNFYIGDSYNHFIPATKKNVLKMFGKSRNLNVYLDTHPVNFNKESDLKDLIELLGNE